MNPYPPESVEYQVIRRAQMEVAELRRKRKDGIALLRRLRQELLELPVCLPFSPRTGEAVVIRNLGNLRFIGRRVWIVGYGTCLEIEYDAYFRLGPHPFLYGTVSGAFQAAFGIEPDCFEFEERMSWRRYYPTKQEEFPVTWVDSVVDIEVLCHDAELSSDEYMTVRRCLTTYVILKHYHVSSIMGRIAALVPLEGSIRRSTILATVVKILGNAFATRRSLR